MNNNPTCKRNGFRSRSSLAKSKNSHLSYKDRLKLAGKEEKGVDFRLSLDTPGYIKV